VRAGDPAAAISDGLTRASLHQRGGAGAHFAQMRTNLSGTSAAPDQREEMAIARPRPTAGSVDQARLYALSQGALACGRAKGTYSCSPGFAFDYI